jgi:translation elongation factor EF-1alpha
MAFAHMQVFTVEMHHKRVESAGPGDNVGMNVKGLDKGNMPRAGDVMIMKSDASLKHVEDFTAQIQTLDIPGELKIGYSPIGFVRCGRSACRVTKIDWKVHSLSLHGSFCFHPVVPPTLCRRVVLTCPCNATSVLSCPRRPALTVSF